MIIQCLIKRIKVKLKKPFNDFIDSINLHEKIKRADKKLEKGKKNQNNLK